jgi:uncharacterized MAPEG superfamily protein
MTIPLWCLLGFVAWTLLLLLGLAGARVSQVAMGGKQPNEFPAGVPHGGDAYWRLNRAHLNCIENLPLFASVVVVGTLAGLKDPLFATLSQVYLGARIGQSVVHLSSGSNLAIDLRFTCFLVQYGCLVGIIYLLATKG